MGKHGNSDKTRCNQYSFVDGVPMSIRSKRQQEKDIAQAKADGEGNQVHRAIAVRIARHGEADMSRLHHHGR